MREFIKQHKRQFDRVIDCLPAFLTTMTLVSLVLCSICFPLWVAYFTTAYMIYYAIESAKVGIYSWRAYKLIKKNREIDWHKRLEKKYGRKLEDFYQAVLIPYVREPESVLEPTIENLLKSSFPAKKIILVMAPEAAYPEGEDRAKKLAKKYANKFGKFYIFTHTLVPGEMKGKASNENNAARELYKALVKENINPENVLVTSLDSDMKPDKEYFSMLTYYFFKEGKKRFRRIFQPLPVNLEKAWETITPARIVASFGFQFYSAIMQMPKRLINFSVYSASLKMIHNVGYWSPDIIPEDERFYWQAYFKYAGKVRVVPVFLPVYGDIIIGDSVWDAIKEQYKQIRRWAWGATEIKYFLYNAIIHPEIPLREKLYKMSWRFRTHFEWVLIPVILSFANILPTVLSEEYRNSPFAYMIPVFSSRVLQILLVMFIILVILDNYFAPKKPKGWKTYKTILSYASWIIFPIVSFVFSAIPAYESQIRMLINKPIIYIETKKK